MRLRLILPLLAACAVLAAAPATTATTAPATAAAAAPAAASTFRVGINAGGWHDKARETGDILRLGRLVRLATPKGSLRTYEARGITVIADMAGPYDRGGVSALDVNAYVERDIAVVRRNPHLFALETLNEPGGSWFWGSDAGSAQNQQAYGRLVVAVHQALVREFGARRPLQLCSADGGHSSSDAWLEGWMKVPGALAACDELTNHPYGGKGSRSTASLGNRGMVEKTIALAHKPVAITEVGFPTANANADSLDYSEREQASAVFNFVAWARSLAPNVALVTIYGYRDSLTGGGYGIELHSGVRKLAYRALQAAALGARCPVCG